MSNPVFVTDLHLAERYSVSRATIWRWAGNGRLPRPVRLSAACTRWRLADVERLESERLQNQAA